MEDIPISERIKDRVVGSLYAILYFTSDRMVFGATLMAWITLALIILAIWIWIRTQTTTWSLLLIGAIILVRISQWKAKRDGFIVFSALHDLEIPENAERIPDNQKYNAWASGLFSVIGREEYMLQWPSKIWRVPIGDFALMVQRPTGRYLYQFIEQGFVQKVQPGYLVYGTRVTPALEIEFLTTWLPEAGEADFNWFSPKEGTEQKRAQRTLYLGFKDRQLRDAIWLNLLVNDNTEIT